MAVLNHRRVPVNLGGEVGGKVGGKAGGGVESLR